MDLSAVVAAMADEGGPQPIQIMTTKAQMPDVAAAAGGQVPDLAHHVVVTQALDEVRFVAAVQTLDEADQIQDGADHDHARPMFLNEAVPHNEAVHAVAHPNEVDPTTATRVARRWLA